MAAFACSSCGRLYADGDRTCVHCGSALPTASADDQADASLRFVAPAALVRPDSTPQRREAPPQRPRPPDVRAPGRRRAWLWALGAVVTTLAVAAGVVGYLYWRGPRVEYCLATETRWDEPRCIAGRRTPDPSWGQHLVVTTERGHTARVERIRRGHASVDPELRTREWEITDFRYEGGTLRETTQRLQDGRIVQRSSYPKGLEEMRVLDGAGRPFASMGGSFTRLTQTFDSKGHDVTHRYFDEDGRPATNATGAYGFDNRFGRGPLPSEVIYTGEDGKPRSVAGAVARCSFTYDRQNLLVEMRCVDAEGRPHGDPCARNEQRFDAHGNPVDLRCVGDDDKPFTKARGGVGERSTFDAKGLRKKTEVFDASGAALLSVEYEHDDAGRLVRTRSLDGAGSPTALAPAHYVERRLAYDTHGRVAEDRAFDGLGGPAAFEHTCHAVRYEYDDKTQEVMRVEYLDERLQPCTNADGVSSRRLTRDEGGVLIAEAFFDARGAPVLSRKEEVHSYRVKVDGRRREIERTNLDVKGAPVRNVDWVCVVRTTYSDADRAELEEYIGPNGLPTFARSGCAGRRVIRDSAGQIVEEQCLDGAGKPTSDRQGIAITRTRRDAQEHLSHFAFLSADARPVAREGDGVIDGFVSDRGTGRRHVIHSRVDGRGVVREIRHTTDETGDRVRTEYLNAQGQLTPRDGAHGYAAKLDEYDTSGRNTLTTYVDPDGARAARAPNGCRALRRAFDARGLPTSESCLGATDQAIASEEGWAEKRIRHDARGRMVREEFFDEAHRPRALAATGLKPSRASSGAAGYIAREIQFGEAGLAEELHYLAAGGALVDDGPNGIAKVIFRFDARGNRIEAKYLNARGELTRDPPGVKTERDERGLVVRVVPLGDGLIRHLPDGNAFVGAMEQGMRYDARGSLIETTWYYEGRIRDSNDGVAVRRIAYDDRGRRESQSFIDANGVAAVHRRIGASRVEYEYEETGRLVARKLIGRGGEALGRQVAEGSPPSFADD